MCSGKDILTAAAVVATVYTGGAAAGLWGAAEGAGSFAATMAAEDALAGGAGAAAGLAGDVGAMTTIGNAAIAADAAATAAAAGTVLGGTGKQVAVGASGAASPSTGASIMGALKTGAQLAPLASLAMMAGGNPKMAAQGVPSPTAPPASQAASTPAPNIFKKKLSALGDPTKASGVGGVADLSLGKATVLGQ